MGKDIYSFLHADSNEAFSSLDSKDLKELKSLLNTYMLSYRKKVGLSEKDTFGTEIEFQVPIKKFNFTFSDMMNKLEKKHNSWNIDIDGSRDDKLEVTPFILKDEDKTWEELEDVLKLIKNYINNPGPFSSSHIHFGGQMIKDTDSLKRFIKLWAIYEQVIFRFAYGEDLTHRKSIDFYSQKMSTVLKGLNKNINLEVIGAVRNRAVNIRNYRGSRFDKMNTIEIRCPNGTLEPVIWQNNINFFARLLEFANSDKCDDDEIDKRFYALNLTKQNYSSYDSINFELAIDLADKIFDNNLEKLYFLRQYTKGFEKVEKGHKKAESFILK